MVRTGTRRNAPKRASDLPLNRWELGRPTAWPGPAPTRSP